MVDSKMNFKKVKVTLIIAAVAAAITYVMSIIAFQELNRR
jgi:hypothetical protein